MRTMRTILAATAALSLAACEPPLPNSTMAGPVVTTPAQAAAAREAQLTGRMTELENGAMPRPRPIDTSGPSSTQNEAERLAEETRAALGIGGTPPPLPTPLETSPPELDRNNPSISQEQDFAAVSAERDIEADAERLRAARERYRVVRPEELELERPADTGPNIFAYALNDARPVGTEGAFRRGFGASAGRAEQRCAAYTSEDKAQEAFLGGGGPERDRLGLDPDGDGNACGWDPAVVRNLVRSQ
ncbi:hypothetical protein JSE7799_00003 [Jannaschia seosinensis]|uniref:Excalibur calcium-binding domain-containing protein n=1 Tax=Jannaschia seosinensis TaxID=313367 RepID=A0A0M7B5R8_9RHOB|nr:hypothetical protein [Jannaschia seosinensis]CUH07074.1 hypothetical protein JSE7799_00003 [Jannaschia seosinensis]